jgi:hypothetical protein
MQEHTSVYHDEPFDVEPDFYIPTDAEAAEMLEIYRDDHDQEVFDEWLINLPDRDLVEMRRAIDTIRRILRSASNPLPIPVLCGWIDLD